MRLFLFITLGVWAGDLASKLAVYHSMRLGQPSVPVLGDWLRLTYIRNAGSAFSLFSGSRWFFVAVALLSVLLVLAFALSRRTSGPLTRAAFGLILGGALGNLTDRIWLGTVIDFLDMGIGSHRWPVYNVADIGVTLGVALLILRLVFDGRTRTLEVPETGRE